MARPALPRSARLLLLLPLVVLSPFLSRCSGERPQAPEIGEADPTAPGLERLAAAAERHRVAAGVPGLAVAWIENGQVSETRGLGVADVKSGKPVTAETVFEAASLSKPVVAYTALILRDRGELELDRPLISYTPYPDVQGDERLDRITARHVLTHSSGLPNWRPGRWTDNPGPLEIEFEPGERFSYSGEGFVFLQRALEAITGLPLERLVDREVLEPLGMASSSFVWREDYERTAATPHDEEGTPQEKQRPREALAAATLHTTAGDYARFMAEMLEPTLVAPETVAAMLTPQIDARKKQATEDEPERVGHIAWGLGWGLEVVDGRVTTFWHWGDNETFRCFVMASPESGDGFVVFTSSFRGLSLGEPLTEEVLPGPHPAFAWMGYERYDAEEGHPPDR
jgi:CubicO group peptidase (beta-lactamase class C family)